MGHEAYSPVGYAYNADQYCLDCIPYVVSPGRDNKRNGYVVQGCNCTECRLSRMAADWKINRMDESSYDSGEFPKAIPYHNDIHAECRLDETCKPPRWSCDGHCAACGEIIDPTTRYMGGDTYADICPGEDNYLNEISTED